MAAICTIVLSTGWRGTGCRSARRIRPPPAPAPCAPPGRSTSVPAQESEHRRLDQAPAPKAACRGSAAPPPAACSRLSMTSCPHMTPRSARGAPPRAARLDQRLRRRQGRRPPPPPPVAVEGEALGLGEARREDPDPEPEDGEAKPARAREAPGRSAPTPTASRRADRHTAGAEARAPTRRAPPARRESRRARRSRAPRGAPAAASLVAEQRRHRAPGEELRRDRGAHRLVQRRAPRALRTAHRQARDKHEPAGQHQMHQRPRLAQACRPPAPPSRRAGRARNRAIVSTSPRAGAGRASALSSAAGARAMPPAARACPLGEARVLHLGDGLVEEGEHKELLRRPSGRSRARGSGRRARPHPPRPRSSRGCTPRCSA